MLLIILSYFITTLERRVWVAPATLKGERYPPHYSHPQRWLTAFWWTRPRAPHTTIVAGGCTQPTFRQLLYSPSTREPPLWRGGSFSIYLLTLVFVFHFGYFPVIAGRTAICSWEVILKAILGNSKLLGSCLSILLRLWKTSARRSGRFAPNT